MTIPRARPRPRTPARFRALSLAALVAASFVASAAAAGPRDVAVFVTRLGGDGATAQPFIDRFLRYVEGETGWPAQSARGAFLTTRRQVMDFVSSTKPGIGMIEPQLYLELRKAQGLQPVAQMESADLNTTRLHVVVKDPAIRSLADLAGRRVWTPLADDPRYLSKVVLKGQADVATFQLKRVKQALRGVRGVLRGDCEATLLDDEQLAAARKIRGGQDLRDIFTSGALPPIPIVVFGDMLPAADREALARTLIAMCGTPDGGAICRELRIDRFVPVDAKAFTEARDLYGE